MVKKNINYKRRKDLESDGISTVWLQIGKAGTKQFLLYAVYQQFQCQGRKGTKSIPSQLNRLKHILTKWEKAQEEEREIITMGDMNMDSLSWDLNWDKIPPYKRQKQTLYKQLKDRILGTFKTNTEYIRVDIQPGGKATCLDHCYTSNPEKINSHRTYHSTFSDHSMVEVNKKV